MIGDTLVFSREHQELDQCLARLARLHQVGIFLNEKKCLFRVSLVKFLGVVGNAHGISPDPDKVKATASRCQLPHRKGRGNAWEWTCFSLMDATMS